MPRTLALKKRIPRRLSGRHIVITSYSIHYTKLYESRTAKGAFSMAIGITCFFADIAGLILCPEFQEIFTFRQGNRPFPCGFGGMTDDFCIIQ